MKRLISLSLMVGIFYTTFAQVERLSEDATPVQNQNQPSQKKDIVLNLERQVTLKTDGTWVMDSVPYIVVQDQNKSRYVLFANGKWSDIETVKDIDGNTYDAVRLGKYYWMLQNLKTTKYANGKPIQHSPTNNEAWLAAQGVYTFPENKAENKESGGLLYNWAAATNSQGLCPQGWRVPSEAEWKNLFDFVGDLKNVGPMLKSKEGWQPFEDTNKNANGLDGFMFNAKPVGYRQMFKDKFSFWQVGGEARFWTSTSKTDKQAMTVIFTKGPRVDVTLTPKEFGYSIRCIKD